MKKLNNRRRSLHLTMTQAKKVRDLAAQQTRGSSSALLRGIMAEYAENGGAYREPTEAFQVLVDEDTLANAERRARQEGVTLLEAIRDRIDRASPNAEK